MAARYCCSRCRWALQQHGQAGGSCERRRRRRQWWPLQIGAPRADEAVGEPALRHGQQHAAPLQAGTLPLCCALAPGAAGALLQAPEVL